MKPTTVDITNRKELNALLNQLTPDTPALWGNLKAQSMIEHLVEAVEYTNGKRIAVLEVSTEEANNTKQLLVHSDFVITRGAKGYLTDATKTKRYKDLRSAIDQLNKEIDAFELFFAIAGKTAIHPAFGAMNHDEWVTWHGKHFTHHLKQFGLINS
jgi:oxepin-CoA hydrolase/3-oxo-5,6-dehydrosuberyl-CoA semialdehyde dehydrogenase